MNYFKFNLVPQKLCEVFWLTSLPSGFLHDRFPHGVKYSSSYAQYSLTRTFMGAIKDSLTLLLTKVCFPFSNIEKSFSFFSVSFCFTLSFFLDFLLLSSSFPSSFFPFHLSSFPFLSFLSPKLNSSGRHVFAEKYIFPYLYLMSPGKKKVPYMEWWNFGLKSEISDNQNGQSLNRFKMGTS